MKKNYGFVSGLFFLWILQGCAVQKNTMQQGSLLGNGSLAEYAGQKIELQNSKSSHGIISLHLKHAEQSTIPVNENLTLQQQLQLHTFLPDTVKTDTAETEPKLQPLIPAGAGIFAAGMALTAVSVITGGISIFIGIGAFIAGLLLTNWGYKKVKAEPKKWKGEKLALAVYYALIPVGLFLMLYPVYLLFML